MTKKEVHKRIPLFGIVIIFIMLLSGCSKSEFDGFYREFGVSATDNPIELRIKGTKVTYFYEGTPTTKDGAIIDYKGVKAISTTSAHANGEVIITKDKNNDKLLYVSFLDTGFYTKFIVSKDTR
ncbi:hypothetical protein IW492_08895 [Enterococcus sp. BWB1-3]|uniref:hypothetical protein n=1 Tax=Enterococcus sp. BWB1-3 TaxID=2787713 RepID=UPI00192112D4|nr:hypothetical protein [Enterococcus sp. BWB1-3]MBL1229346.1 hypothetical protein [Enterococcus sp. BWB1-3]